MKVKVYDSHTGIDRYTVVFEKDRRRDFFAMSEDPLHPQSVNMFCGTQEQGYSESNLGDLLDTGDIPAKVQKAIDIRLSALEAAEFDIFQGIS